MMLSALVISNQFIKKAKEEKIADISPMKLQKLLYFLYGEYAAKTGKPLFSERFEAWKYGPVLTSVYQEFKSFGAQNIDMYYTASGGETYFPNEKSDENKEFFSCFNSVWEKYKNLSGVELSNKTHESGPWAETKPNGEIDFNKIKKYFELEADNG